MATTAGAWAKPGAWALDSEEHESELLKENGNNDQNSSNNGDSAAGLSDFPSLATAAATKSKKKSKGQTLSLQEFVSAKQAPTTKGLTTDELLALPTGPRQRTAEELELSKLGGGFRNYGYDRHSRGPSDEQPRRQRDSVRDFAPSRADEIDDWGANKKTPIGSGFDRRERGEKGGFFPDSKSRADEVDNWGSNKTFVPSDSRRYDRKGGFESNGGGADSDNWLKKKEEDGRRFGNSFDSLRERRGVSFESSNGGGTGSDSWSRRGEEGSGRPRLNLQPRTLPVGEGQQLNGIVAKPKGSNPFGEARPREEVLKEKGQIPKEIEEKLESVKINEAAGHNGPSAFVKRGFGSGSWRGSSPEEKKERSWRKPESLDASRPPSVGSNGGPVEAVEDGDAQNDA